MDEETMIPESETVEDTTDYLDGWDDEPAMTADSTESESTEEADQPDEGEEADAEPAEAEDTPAPETESGTEPEAPTEEAQDFTPVTIRYNGEEKTVSDKAEATILMQKGMNYDKIHERMESAEAFRNENADAFELISRLAALQSQQDKRETPYTPQEYVELTNVKLLMAQGMTEQQARKELELNKREAAVKTQEAEPEQAKTESADVDAVAKDKAAFQSAFPDVKMDDIPKEVWADLSSNRSQGLTAAYAKYLVKSAQDAAAQAQQAAEKAKAKSDSRKRSPGSMRNTNPKSKQSDPMLDGWE